MIQKFFPAWATESLFAPSCYLLSSFGNIQVTVTYIRKKMTTKLFFGVSLGSIYCVADLVGQNSFPKLSVCVCVCGFPPLILTATSSYSWASLVAQTVKNLFTVQETWVWSLGWEDPLRKAMATHSNILAWRILWMEESGRLQSMESQRAVHDWATFTTTSLSNCSYRIFLNLSHWWHYSGYFPRIFF